MDTFLNDPRVRTLLQEADHALNLVDSMRRRGHEADEIRDAMEGIHRDLGRALHEWARANHRIRAEGEFARALAEEGATFDAGSPSGNPELTDSLVSLDGLEPLDSMDGVEAVEDDVTEESEGTPPPAPPRTVVPVDVAAAVGFNPEVARPADAELSPPGFSATQAPAGETTDGEGWYTDEVEVPDHLFTEEDGLSERLPGTPLDEPSLPELMPLMPAQEETIERRATRPARPSGPIIKLASRDDMAANAGWVQTDLSPDAGPAWIDRLRELLEILEEPSEATDPRHLAAEAARIQLAASNLEARWSRFPDSIQTALLGLVSARLRHLEQQLGVDLGPRLALDRLRRYRKAAGLGKVTGLVPARGPETRSWAEDARRWWAVLNEGLGPTPP